MSIYKEQLPSIANRIGGDVRGVPNSRRKYITVGSRYKVGKARSKNRKRGR